MISAVKVKGARVGLGVGVMVGGRVALGVLVGVVSGRRVGVGEAPVGVSGRVETGRAAVGVSGRVDVGVRLRVGVSPGVALGLGV